METTIKIKFYFNGGQALVVEMEEDNYNELVNFLQQPINKDADGDECSNFYVLEENHNTTINLDNVVWFEEFHERQ